MHIHILGICGTFMGGIALLARQKGYRVTGSDLNVYPPMSTQLEQQGIELIEGYDPSQLDPAPDCVIVGNAMSRGNPCVEYLLNRGMNYRSGPQWLNENILNNKWVLAVAGTHGKTTTSSMLTWILEYAGYEPGFLVGGVLQNFALSARFTDSDFFVVEADEYDTAFFDKRSKFVHYRGRTVVLNNLEFDHADIFENLQAIQTQFHHLVRTIPGDGQIIWPGSDEALQQVLSQGCWSTQQTLGEGFDWHTRKIKDDGSAFEVWHGKQKQGQVQWSLFGDHNVSNALAAMVAARHVGVEIPTAIEALAEFKNVKRRLELRGQVSSIKVFDDFAHHPTAIIKTLEGLRRHVGKERIMALLDLRSNTMKAGVHKDALINALNAADEAIVHLPEDAQWQLDLGDQAHRIVVVRTPQQTLEVAMRKVRPEDNVLVMSNGSFGGIHEKLLNELTEKDWP